MFGQQAGYARFAYNWAVGEFQAGLEDGEWLTDRTLRPTPTAGPRTSRGWQLLTIK